MKKLTAILISALMIVSIFSAVSVSADETELGTPSGFNAENALYVHAVLNSADGEAWQAWQSAHDEDFYEAKPTEKASTAPETTAQETTEPTTANPTEPETEPIEKPSEAQQPTEPVTAPSIIPVDPVSEPVTEPQIQPATDPKENPSAVTKITLKKKSAIIYRRGTYKIPVKIENKKGAAAFRSSKPKVAEVSSKGKIKALKKGTAYITIKNNGKSVKFKIKVKNPRLKVKKKTLKLGKKYKIKIIGKVGKAKFAASNRRIRVTKKGYIKALRKGKAEVKVKTNGIKLTFKVNVK